MRLLLATGLMFTLNITTLAAGNLADFKRPLTIPFEKSAPYSPQIAALGKMLFFDPRLSGNKNMTCASCHNPSFGFESPDTTPVGAENTHLGRQAPTVLNAAWVKPLFWDGRAKDLEAQASGPITAGAEMGGNLDDAVKNLNTIPEYKKWFTETFPGTGVTKENLLTAIATWERTVVSSWSPFDRWVDGDPTAVSDSAKRGFDLFTGKAGCANCHSGWNLTNNKFDDIGLDTQDIGRGKYEPDNVKAQYAFKVPGLRNTLYRGPYMHDGSLATMIDVIRHYESGGIERPSKAEAMVPVMLTESEENDLIAFLSTLTAEQQEVALPTLPN